MSCQTWGSVARKLKFGSPAWRAKYMKNAGKKKKKRAGPNSYTRKGGAAKKKRLREMIQERGNPPGSWTPVKAFRVIKQGRRTVLQVKK